MAGARAGPLDRVQDGLTLQLVRFWLDFGVHVGEAYPVARSGDPERGTLNPSMGDEDRPAARENPHLSLASGREDQMLQWKSPRFIALVTTLALLAAWVGGAGARQWGW